MKNSVFINATLATMTQSEQPYGLLQAAALVVADGLIRWCGPMADLPSEYAKNNAQYPHMDLGARVITPALIDCHTHLIYGGNRAREFEQRLQGASYEALARAGGGILSTVAATRAASEAQLLAMALPRVDAFIAEGVSTLEIKSGYGLDQASEIKMLRVARCIGELRPIRIKTTFLAAHALPEEYANAADAYIDQVCLPSLEAAAAEHLVDAVDGFCENIGFTPAQITRVFNKAHDLGLAVKLHAEQLSNQGASALAAAHGALSADHLEYLDDEGIEAMAKAGTVAVLLPGAFYTLGETQLPPIAALRQASVPMAVASDCNPGSSPLNSLLLAMNMAATLFKLTPEEALLGTTRNAAKALGIADAGMLAAGLRADLAIWDIRHPAELVYGIGFNPLRQRVFGGEL